MRDLFRRTTRWKCRPLFRFALKALFGGPPCLPPFYVTYCLFVICPDVLHLHSCRALLSGHWPLWSFPLCFTSLSLTHSSAEGSFPPQGTDYFPTWTEEERAPIPMPVNLSHQWIISLLLPSGKNVKHFYVIFFFSGWEGRDEYVLPRRCASSFGNYSWPHGQWSQLSGREADALLADPSLCNENVQDSASWVSL